MSTNDWKNKELNGLLNERWGFSMNLNKLNEGCGGDLETEEVYQEQEEEFPLEVIDQPEEMEAMDEVPVEISVEEPMGDAASTLEAILGELTVDQLKAALQSKQG